ncbi:MAG: dihydrodipicolinate reductase C-terminal domain-containing protein [Gemmatimonadales bacterium]|nr:dihydrodipicolinate reductase C-terminal domain-containing protein [Gemmatimonadales bacterium]
MRVLVVGDGKMGQAVAEVARQRGHEVVAVLGPEQSAAWSLELDAGSRADVAIEFTAPWAVVGNLEWLVAAGLPVVCGTTGWDGRLAEVTAMVEHRRGALLHAANFSIGVQLFLRAATQLAAAFRGRTGFGAAIVEEHHAAKRDAPSGTALALQRAVHAADPDREVPISSVRVGAVPGTHALILDALRERIELVHTARDRAVFAEGAVQAAEWLAGRRGVFTMHDLLDAATS